MPSSREPDRLEVERALAALGFDSAIVEYWGEGVASQAWRVRHPDLVFRLMRADNWRPSTYRLEHELTRRMLELGLAVPRPVATSDNSGVLPADWKAWAIEKWMDGRPWVADDGLAVWQDVGAVLRDLHAMPVEGFGPLTVDEHGAVRGSYATDAEGLRVRWQTATPWFGIDDAGLALLDRTAPHTAARLRLAADNVEQSALGGSPVVLHSDLHAAHVLVDGGRLVGMLDFGGAFRGSAAWEFAAIGIFNGWPAADAAIGAYRADPGDLATAARYAALSFAVYRHNVESTEHHDERADVIRSRMEATLDELGT